MTEKTYLIIIDVQEGVFKQKFPVYNEKGLLENLNTLINKTRKSDIKIIFFQHENSSFLKKDSQNWEIKEEIYIESGDMILNKKHPSIFKKTLLPKILKQEQINQLFIAGLVSNGCVKLACIEALELKLKTVLVSDAHSTFYKNSEKIIADTNKELQEKGVILRLSLTYSINKLNLNTVLQTLFYPIFSN